MRLNLLLSTGRTRKSQIGEFKGDRNLFYIARKLPHKFVRLSRFGSVYLGPTKFEVILISSATPAAAGGRVRKLMASLVEQARLFKGQIATISASIGFLDLNTDNSYVVVFLAG